MTQLSDVNKKTAETKRADSCNTKPLTIKDESFSIPIETEQNLNKYCDTNAEKLESDLEDSDMYAIENWRNKAKKDDPILSLLLSDSPIKKNRKICTDTSESKDQREGTRKQSKYLRAYPEIKHSEVTSHNKNRKVNVFLINGNSFKNALRLENRCVMVKNTCGFDSLTTIIAFAVMDSAAYFDHIEQNSTRNPAFAFEEFTYCRNESCRNGHTMEKVFVSILLNEDIIKTKGYQALQESLLLDSRLRRCSQNNCTSQVVEETICFNMQLFVELDISLTQIKFEACLNL